MKFLIIGLGSIGVRHARNLIAMGHEVYGCDLDQSRFEATGIKKELSALTYYDGHIICSPTSEHRRHLWNAISDNTNAFVEKPIADKPDGVGNLLDESRRTKALVAVGNNLRFNPSCRLAKRYINDGAIGTPLWASIVVAQFNDRPQYRRDGVTLNWGAHEIDLALWLLGPARVAAASIDKNDTIADICLAHDDGCRSVVHLDYLTRPEMRQTVIVGDKGRMVVSLTGRYVVLQQGERFMPPDHQDGSFDDDYRNEMIAFVNALQGKPWPGATGDDGLATLKIIDKAREMASAT